MQSAETLIHHASDFIDWIDASGCTLQHPTIKIPLALTLVSAPQNIQLVSRPGRTLIWRQQASHHPVVKGHAAAADMAQPATEAFDLKGEIHDHSRQFNPRQFNLVAGEAKGHQVELFRSPFGSRFASAGGLYGNLIFENAEPASWALLTLSVTPLIGPPLNFRAQADEHGDFVMPLDRLPTLNKDAPRKNYDATLSVSALSSASKQAISDPDSFISVEIADVQTAAQFSSTINFTVIPSTVTTLKSKDQSNLILRTP